MKISNQKNNQAERKDAMNEFINLLGNFGFPIFMVVYLLGRFENLFKDMTNSINQLENTIIKHFEKE